MAHSRVTKSMQNKQMNQRVKPVLRNDNRMIHQIDEFPPDPISCTLRRVGPGSAAACLGSPRRAAQVESAPVPFGTGCGRHLLSPWPGHRHTAGRVTGTPWGTSALATRTFLGLGKKPVVCLCHCAFAGLRKTELWRGDSQPRRRLRRPTVAKQSG